ncbi:MAG TPA: restriction endonuclease [Rhodocyclaceae bacterium]|nr:restriction endonuclease [Rhodocyclaceae bacterium]
MLRNQESGLLDLITGNRWSVAAWRATAVFVAGYAIPSLLFGRNGHAGGVVHGVQFLATVLTFVFTAAALFVFAQSRAAGVESPESSVEDHATKAAPTHWSMELLRQIEWKNLSALCTALYQEKGFRVVAMPLDDKGIFGMQLFQGDSERPTSIAQCQAWGELTVGIEPIHRLLATMVAEQVPKAFFMTPGSFTEDARALATDRHITLIDGKLLLAMTNRLPGETGKQLLHKITAADYTTPSCPACGLKMITSEDEHGSRWGCRAFPRCKQTLAMRGAAA